MGSSTVGGSGGLFEGKKTYFEIEMILWVGAHLVPPKKTNMQSEHESFQKESPNLLRGTHFQVLC